MNESRNNHVSVAVIGAGFGGIGLGARFVGHGMRDFLIFDRATGVGGTWWSNRYPGCACDVPSHLYSLSFAPHPDWTRRFAPRDEIQAYLEHCVTRFDVQPHLVLGTGIERAVWDEQMAIWRLTDDHGKAWSADVVVSAIGGLSRPAWPQIPGLEQFRGSVFHSQQWDDAVELAGKRVAVIGTGASAAQFVPEIAEKVESLDVYMRSPQCRKSHAHCQRAARFTTPPAPNPATMKVNRAWSLDAAGEKNTQALEPQTTAERKVWFR